MTSEYTVNAKADKSNLLDAASEKSNKNLKTDNNECTIDENNYDDDSDLNKDSKSRKKRKKNRKSGEINYNGQIAIVKTKAACCTIM